MASLTDLISKGVTSITPYAPGGIEVRFDDNTTIWVEHNLNIDKENNELQIEPQISIWGTSIGGGASSRVVLKCNHILTKAKLIVQELSFLIEKL
jgi:hypothetical protein